MSLVGKLPPSSRANAVQFMQMQEVPDFAGAP
jgi:hypothetical protein